MPESYKHIDETGAVLYIDVGGSNDVYVGTRTETGSGHVTVELPPSERQAAAQALAGDGCKVLTAADWDAHQGTERENERLKRENDDLRKKLADADLRQLARGAMQEDLARILDALGLGDHARPQSPHEVVLHEVLPRIQELQDYIVGGPPAQPERPEPVDPSEVKAEALREAADEVANGNGSGIFGLSDWLRERADRIWPDPSKVDAMKNAIRDVVLSTAPHMETEVDEDDIAELAHGLVLRGIEARDG